MTQTELAEMLEKAKIFFKEHIAAKHIINTKKINKISKLQINPFTYKYLSNFLTGNESPESIAKALILPRVLGTSFTTSFGTNIQNQFCAEVLAAFGSMHDGIDIEFKDHVDNRLKYCQLKAGPNTINKDDVEPIKHKFRALTNRARVNNLNVLPGDMVIGVTYGKITQISGHYKKIADDYNIYIGQDFWHRLTGSPEFYYELIDTFGEVAKDIDGTCILNETIESLAEDIQSNLNQDFWK